VALSGERYEDERDEALALLWLDDGMADTDEATALASRALTAWGPTPERPPADLLDAVTAAARSARSPGPASGPPPPDVDPVDTYRRTAADLSELLASLDEGGWNAPSPGYGTVAATVAHLVGIERVCRAWLADAPAPPPEALADHHRSSQPAIDELAGAPQAAVCATWRDLTARVTDAARRLPASHPVFAHDIPTDRDGLLLLRSFELWAHHDDIADAVGRARLDVDAGRLLTLSRALAQALPFTFALRGEESPEATVRLVLIGRGGGTYDLALGPGPDPTPTATIVLDTVDACRLAQRRVARDAVDIVVEGDQDVAAAVLDRIGALARD
jgi:uncharacterized protein (TIGR03083 family)